jgi:hypothetical protein
LELQKAKGPPISILVILLHKKNSIMLKKMQASSILSWVIVVSLATSQLPPLDDTTPHRHGQPIAGGLLLRWRDYYI